MKDSVYLALKMFHGKCIKCGMLNFSSALFDTSLFETSNSFDPVTHDVSDHEISFSCPQATSSPKTVPSYQPRVQHVLTSSSTAPDTPSVAAEFFTHPCFCYTRKYFVVQRSPKHRDDIPIKIRNVNCHSIVDKKSLLENMLESTQADIVLAQNLG